MSCHHETNLDGGLTEKKPKRVTSIEKETKEEIMQWVKRVEVPWTKREAVEGRCACLGLTVASGCPILSRLTKTEMTWIRSMNRWLKRKLKEAKMESFRWSSIQVNVNTVSRWHVDRNNEGPSLIAAVGNYEGGEFEFEEQTP